MKKPSSKNPNSRGRLAQAKRKKDNRRLLAVQTTPQKAASLEPSLNVNLDSAPSNWRSYGLPKKGWTLVITVAVSFCQTFLPIPEEWKNLLFWLMFILLSWAIWAWICANSTRIQNWSRNHRIIPIFGVVILFCVAIWLGKPRKQPDFLRGAKYPEISVELYWGPTNGMHRTLMQKEANAGICVLRYENTEVAPVYDFAMTVLEPDQLVGRIPAIGSTNLGRYATYLTSYDLKPTNQVRFRFIAYSRSAVTAHNFNYIATAEMWVHSNNIVDMDSDKVLTQDVSPGFATSKPVNYVLVYENEGTPPH
jgi:hypothetical protein